jgi:hypothetical protein
MATAAYKKDVIKTREKPYIPSEVNQTIVSCSSKTGQFVISQRSLRLWHSRLDRGYQWFYHIEFWKFMLAKHFGECISPKLELRPRNVRHAFFWQHHNDNSFRMDCGSIKGQIGGTLLV